MSGNATLADSAVKGLRIWLGIAGAVTLLTGLAIVLWPGGAAQVLTVLLAIYTIVTGVVYIVAGIMGGQDAGWSRILHVLLGVVFIAAGVMAVLNPATTAATLAIIVVVFIGIAWIVEGVASLTTLGFARNKGWTVFFAIVSILGGIAVMFSPLFAAAFLLIWIGVSMIVIGLFGLIRAFTLGRG